jgi:hypothetical protein
VRFLLELVLLVALGWWGMSLDAPLLVRLLAAVGAVGAALLVWSRWVAPRAAGRLGDPPRFAVETVLWIAGALALADVWSVAAGAAFLALALVTAALVRVWPEPVHGRAV